MRLTAIIIFALLLIAAEADAQSGSRRGSRNAARRAALNNTSTAVRATTPPTYYFSNSGNDAYPGTSIDSAKQTIAALNAMTFQPGDRIMFKKGDIWRESLTVPSSGTAGNPVTFDAYGTGANPVIDGADALSSISPLYNGSSVWSATLTTNASAGTYYNWRLGVTASASGTKIRIRFTASTGASLTITGASIGKRLNETDDFNGSPTRLTFSGENSVVVPTSGDIYCDEVDFEVESGGLYLVHVYSNNATAFRYGAAGSGIRYRSTTNVDNTLTETIDYGTVGTSAQIVTEMQVLSPVENMYAKTGVTTQPYITWYNDTIAPLAADTASLDVDGEWYYDATDDIWYMYATSDPSGKVDLGQRGTLIDASSRNYVTVNNLTLQNSNDNNIIGFGSPRAALYAINASNLTVSGCTIQDNSLHGIRMINSQNVTIDNNTLLRNGTMNWNGRNADIRTILSGTHPIGRYYTFTNNISSYAGADGLMILTTDMTYPVKHITISGNTFEHNAAAGCYVIKADTVSIHNNSVAYNGDSGKTGEDYGIAIQSGSNTDIYNNTVFEQVYGDAIEVYGQAGEPAHNARIFNNHIYDIRAGRGIEVIPFDDQSMLNCEIFYNLIDSTSDHALVTYRTGTGTADTVKIYNNTFNGAGNADVLKSSTIPIELKNNIFYNSVGTSVQASLSTSGLITSNNLWYRASGNVLSYNSTNYTSANITNFEASAQTTDPLFVGTGTYPFSLQTGSPAINAGVNVGLTHDILGNPIVGNPDIGSHEKQ